MSTGKADFLSAYLQYVSDTETPTIFNRWAAIATVGAYLGRRYYFNHGHFVLNPNIYCMLVGSPGTRKSTAIKMAKKLLMTTGYNTIAADKTTKEKFLVDLSGEPDRDTTFGKKDVVVEDFLNNNLWGDNEAISRPDAEMFIMADEFNDFFGNGNIEFVSLLGTLWDYSGVYSSRIKNGKSIQVNNPTISILGGNTPTGLALSFPPEVLGQGFFSRLLFIYGEPNGKRITFPEAPSEAATTAIRQYLQLIKGTCVGAAKISTGAKALLERIYIRSGDLSDSRFDSYSTRRFTHLLKLCLITSASRVSTDIVEGDVIYANTILAHAEHNMPKALGEFGKGKHSDVAHKIVSVIEREDKVVTFKDIWKHVSSDLEKMGDLATLLQNLVTADKIQSIPNKGFFAKRRVLYQDDDGLVDYSLLTDEERKAIV